MQESAIYLMIFTYLWLLSIISGLVALLCYDKYRNGENSLMNNHIIGSIMVFVLYFFTLLYSYINIINKIDECEFSNS
jgi:hypothetical protein